MQKRTKSYEIPKEFLRFKWGLNVVIINFFFQYEYDTINFV
jgi:hypothetical protein